jgi:hypothetical protein
MRLSAIKMVQPLLFLSFSIKKEKKLFWRKPKTTIFAIPKTDKLSAETFKVRIGSSVG